MRNPCKNKSKALELVEDGLVNAYTMLVSCIAYMSEDEIGDMLHCEGYDDDEDEFDNDDDNDGVEK